MERSHTVRIAKMLMRLHGLKGWKLEIVPKFSRTYRSCYGLCHKTKKIIFLLERFTKCCNASQLVNLMLHEIAHALVGIRHDHDQVWRDKCIEIGGRPTVEQEHCVPERYQAICKLCGQFFTRSRRVANPDQHVYCCDCPTQPIIEFVDVKKLGDPEKFGYRSYL